MTRFSRDKLIAMRIAAGIRQWEVADALGIRQKNYHEKEKKGQAITCDQLAVIADCLDVDISDFFENNKAKREGDGFSNAKEGGNMRHLEAYERIIAHMDKMIDRLENEVKRLGGNIEGFQGPNSEKEDGG